ncbi:hypothetical protein SEVIR_4G237401v4 [Setaria viridis]
MPTLGEFTNVAIQFGRGFLIFTRAGVAWIRREWLARFFYGVGVYPKGRGHVHVRNGQRIRPAKPASASHSRHPIHQPSIHFLPTHPFSRAFSVSGGSARDSDATCRPHQDSGARRGPKRQAGQGMARAHGNAAGHGGNGSEITRARARSALGLRGVGMQHPAPPPTH